MPIGSHLIHRCTVQRYAETAQGYGEQRTPAAHLTDVHCRLKTEQQRAFNTLGGQWLVTTRYKLLVQFLEDVAAGDRVTNIKDEYGVIDTHTYEVAGATPLRGHMQRLNKLELNKVS